VSKLVLEGPPWGQFVDEDEAYVRSQVGTMGSGALGGWSQANLGGFFTQEPANEIRASVANARPPAIAGLLTPVTK
jgi:hypothetical protein